jgi:hypothetical protein
MKRPRRRDARRQRPGWHELAHWLHDPSLSGRSTYRLCRMRIHLIPGAWLDRACNRHDQRHDVA